MGYLHSAGVLVLAPISAFSSLSQIGGVGLREGAPMFRHLQVYADHNHDAEFVARM